MVRRLILLPCAIVALASTQGLVQDLWPLLAPNERAACPQRQDECVLALFQKEGVGAFVPAWPRVDTVKHQEPI